MNFDALEKRYGLPSGMLAAVQRVESGGNPKAVSPKGAQGLFQIMPATAKELGVNALDPAQAADGAARYLAQNLKRFGTPELALAAYNAGPGNVQKHGGIPPFKETQNYVLKVQANMGKPTESGPWEDYANESGPWEDYAPKQANGASGSWSKDTSIPDDIKAYGAGVGKGVGSVALGLQRLAGRGLQKIGADSAGDWLVNDALQGREKLKTELAPYKLASPMSAGAGELTGEVASTLPVGGVAAKGLSMLPGAAKATPIINSIRTSGFRTGINPTTGAGRVADVAVRSAGGGATGYAAAGLVDPEQANTGGAIGAALPGATKLAGVTGGAIGRAITGDIAPEVKALAARAKALGIDVPVDRIRNSKPLNALASGLNYVPFSGRAGTEARMQSQLNRALSRTFGQDSDNVTMALRKASSSLGGEFDRVLKSNALNVDAQFVNDLADAANKASRELGADGAGIISKQVDDIISKAGTGQIDGQAAYNIKKTLDRISNRSTPEAFYARELKKSLMSALDRSLGPKEAAKFAVTRKRYGNMLELENLAQNGAEGNVSIARIANLKNINNPDLQELADISAQFLKPREGQHGAAQRAAASLGIGGFIGLPALAGTVAAGRAANSMMNSSIMRNAAMGQPRGLLSGPLEGVPQLGYQVAPILGTQ